MDENIENYYVWALDHIEPGDNEQAHATADDLLVAAISQAGYPGIARAFERARERVGFWYA